MVAPGVVEFGYIFSRGIEKPAVGGIFLLYDNDNFPS